MRRSVGMATIVVVAIAGVAAGVWVAAVTGDPPPPPTPTMVVFSDAPEGAR